MSQQGSSAGVVASSSFCREEAKGGAIFFSGHLLDTTKSMVFHKPIDWWLVGSYFVGQVCTVREFSQRVVGGLGWCLGQQKIPQLSGVKKNRSGLLKGKIEISEIIGTHL